MVEGSLDENARPFNSREQLIAELLVGEGRKVVAVPESDVNKTGDALVDGQLQEWKSLDPQPANDRTINNRLHEAKKQAPHVFIDARNGRLTSEEARRGIEDFNKSQWSPSRQVQSIRIEGKDFRLEYKREKAHESLKEQQTPLVAETQHQEPKRDERGAINVGELIGVQRDAEYWRQREAQMRERARQQQRGDQGQGR